MTKKAKTIDTVIRLIGDAEREIDGFNTDEALNIFYNARGQYIEEHPPSPANFIRCHHRANAYALAEFTTYLVIKREEYFGEDKE
ncbi:MAG: hypothetical protein CL811_06535 [Colwelliaceae bacterium]|jgi:hypothetical protein|nr:hypothetical protein [Colwelliaceae bacterium]|tara:strand:- start:610 stop:864 length:255 start_codon:yes stop_codon:yes gene_type:complete